MAFRSLPVDIERQSTDPTLQVMTNTAQQSTSMANRQEDLGKCMK